METKGKVVMEIEREGETFQFVLPQGTSLGVAYDACHIFLQEMVKMAQQKADESAPQNSEEEQKEE